ncbi:MAG: UPF0179 family protein [Candidatus Syntropharchaeia archaeon]
MLGSSLWSRIVSVKEESKMKKSDVSITLIGTRLAKIGTEFIFNGPVVECENCKLRDTCLNLETGRKYRIVGLRNTKHECPIHDSGVCAVEVVESPIIVAIETKKAFNGSKIIFEAPECNEVNCSLYDLCHPLGIKNGDRFTISEVIGNTPEACPQGLSLKLVEVKR